MSNKSSVLPLVFSKLYKENQYYSYYTCLNELRWNLDNLRTSLSNNDIIESRAIAHQLVGTSSIIQDNQIAHDILEMQSSIKKAAHNDIIVKQIDGISIQLTNLYQRLDQENPPIRIVFFAKNMAVAKKALSIINGESDILDSKIITDIDAVDTSINNTLPDFLLVIGQLEVDDKKLKTTQKRRPGTIIFQLNEEDISSKDFIKDFKNLKKFRITNF